MILNSRNEKGWLKSLHRMIWPKKSYLRSLRYHGKRILRIRATPHALALGFSVGVFAAFSPALGLHFLMALALAWGLGGNLIAAGIGTAAANPLTFPLMIASEFEVGSSLFGMQGSAPMSFHVIGDKLTHFEFAGMWQPVIKPLLLGSVMLGAIFGIATYLLIFFTARTFEARKLEAKHRREVILP